MLQGVSKINFDECVELRHIGQNTFIKIIYLNTLQHLVTPPNNKNNSLEVLQFVAMKKQASFFWKCVGV